MNAIPHIFECQKTSPTVPTDTKGTMKRKRTQLVEEATEKVEKVPIETVTSGAYTIKSEKYDIYFCSIY